MFRVHQDQTPREELMLDLDEIARQGARRMLAQALEAEVDAYIEAAKDQRDESGHALVVRNGRAREREILLGAGTVDVRAPRVNDKRVDENGQRRRFKSVILPPYVRRSPKVTEVLPLLYLHGLFRAETSSRLSRSSSVLTVGSRPPPSPALQRELAI
jgi:transposase-like protein